MGYRRPADFDRFDLPRTGDVVDFLIGHVNSMAEKINEMNTALERTTGEQELTINNVIRGGGTSAAAPATSHNLLSSTHPDTLVTSITPGSILRVNAGSLWSEYAIGAEATYLRSTAGLPTWTTIPGSDITGAALTKVDDTNVTLTLGGTPATALLRAASLTLGWTGTLAVTRGGTGLGAFAQGDILYASAANVVAGLTVGSNLQFLRSNGTIPVWQTISTSDITEGTNLYYTDERVDDRVAGLLQNTTSIAWTYNDGLNTLEANVQANTTVQKVAVRKNSTGGDIGARRRLNLIEGTNITLTIADDAGADDEVDITIAAAGGGGAHDILSATHSDTLVGAVVRGDVIVGNSTPKWSRLAIGTAGKYLKSDGTDVGWDTVVATAALDYSNHFLLMGG